MGCWKSCAILMLVIGTQAVAGENTASPERSHTVPSKAQRGDTVIFTVPGLLAASGGSPIPYENGFMLVPENRERPDSRLIAVRYLRFPGAVGARRGADPVVMLPGGPGTLVDESFISDTPWLIATIRRTRADRDFVIIQQRGIKDGAYAASPQYDLPALPADQPVTADAVRDRLRTAVAKSVSALADSPIDLRGYSITELVADVDTLRSRLGYRRLVLIGGSFGSQWSLAYIKTHPDRVARAMLTGLEPLDYGWDDPAALLAAIDRIGDYARADAHMTDPLLANGLAALYKRVIEKLEAAPPTVVVTDPSTGKPTTVVLSPQDLRQIRYPASGPRRASVEAWPRFLVDLGRGDYRYLAQLALRNRRASSESLLGEMIDGSLSISAARRRRLDGHAEAIRWLGDPNADYRSLDGMLPVKRVRDAFLANFPIDVPLVVFQGDLDQSTPVENVLDERPYFRRGKVVIVERATHDVKGELAVPEINPSAGPVWDQIMQFLLDDRATAATLQLPDHIALAPLHFVPLDGPALYERARAGTGLAN